MLNKTNSIVVISLCLIIFSIQVVGNTGSVYAAGDYTSIDSYITAAMKRNNIPGLAMAFTQGDGITYSKGYGTAGNGRPVTADTPFYIGSQSKSFTALAIMQLVEQGKLELDAPVQTYLPWFRVGDLQASQKITIRHLLQHTSGLSESGYTENFPQNTPLEVMVRDLSRARLTAPVGSKMQYFNQGYDTLGLIIETVSGKSYGDFIRENIFVPLKMTNSFTDPAEAEAVGLSQGFSQIFMLPIPLKQSFYQFDLPAGYIMSSANDMARFLNAMGNGGELDGVRVLEPENVQLIFTPNTAIQSTYGFGWYIGQYNGETKITHGGDTERFHTSVLLLPQSKRSLVMLFNENHLVKDYNEYNTIFWGVAGILTDNPLPAKGTSSILYGWGLFAIWLGILVMAGRKIIKLPQWRGKMLTWDSRRRMMDIIKHLLGIAVTVLIVIVIAPALMNCGFSWKWFLGFLPDIAIIVATLVLDDMVQVVLKLRMMAGIRKI